MVQRLIEVAIGALAGAGDLGFFGLRAAREAFIPPFEFRETVRQIYELGLRSAPLILVSGLAVGVVLSMHTRASLERFGAESMIPAGLAIALVRETGPLTAGLLLGCAFVVGQEARGAHFLSHDLAGAAGVWRVQLGLYAAWRRGASGAVQRERRTARVDRSDQDGGDAALAPD